MTDTETLDEIKSVAEEALWRMARACREEILAVEFAPVLHSALEAAYTAGKLAGAKLGQEILQESAR